MTVEIDTRIEAGEWPAELPDALRFCQEAARAALAAGVPGIGAAEMGIVLTDDATIARLNREFRDTDAPTNVLAFATECTGADGWADLPDGAPRLLGDVVIAFETTRAEAREAGTMLEHHLRHLVVHGVLHLLGYDHQVDAEADRMESLEAAILSGFGVADPYTDREHSAA